MLLSTTPFRRAPLLLWRHPVVAAIGGTAVIPGVVVGLTPQFLSSASSEALHRELSGRCASSHAGHLDSGGRGASDFFGVNERSRGRLAESVSGRPSVGDPIGRCRPGFPITERGRAPRSCRCT